MKGGEVIQQGIHGVVDVEDNSFENGKIIQRGRNNFVSVEEDSLRNGEIIQENRDNRIEVDRNGLRDGKIIQKSDDSDVVLSEDGGRNIEIEQRGNGDTLELRNSAGIRAKINSDGDHNDIELRQTAAESASVNITGQKRGVSVLNAADRSGEDAHIIVGENAKLSATDSALLDANVNVRQGGIFDAKGQSCEGCSITVSGGTVVFNKTSALKDASVVLCNRGQLLDEAGIKYTSESIHTTSLLRDFVELGNGFDANCDPVNHAGKIAAGILVPLSVVGIVGTATGITLYVKRNEVKKCLTQLRANGYNFKAPKFDGAPTKQTHGNTTELTAIEIQEEPSLPKAELPKPQKSEGQENAYDIIPSAKEANPIVIELPEEKTTAAIVPKTIPEPKKSLWARLTS